MDRRTKEYKAQEAARVAEVAAQTSQVPQAPQEEKSENVPVGVERPPSRNEPRRAAMEEVVARHNKTSGIEEEIKPELKPEPKPEAEPEAAEVIPQEEAPPESTPEIKMVKVKVDGEEFEVAQTEVDDAGSIRAYQTQRAAENRLKKANEAVAEVRRTQAAIAEWSQKHVQTPVAPVPTDNQFLASKIDVIRYGTPEESSTALQEVLDRSQSKLDPQAVMNLAVVHVNRQAAITKFKDEFSEVVGTPLLLKLAETLEKERIAQIPAHSVNTPQFATTFDWGDFYRKIGNEVRGAVGRPSQPTTTPVTPGDPSPPSDKEARKASIVNLPTASARAELPKEEKPETRAETLNSMRKARGLPTG